MDLMLPRIFQLVKPKYIGSKCIAQSSWAVIGMYGCSDWRLVPSRSHMCAQPPVTPASFQTGIIWIHGVPMEPASWSLFQLFPSLKWPSWEWLLLYLEMYLRDVSCYSHGQVQSIAVHGGDRINEVHDRIHEDCAFGRMCHCVWLQGGSVWGSQKMPKPPKHQKQG